MSKSNDYKQSISNLLVYYYQELISEGDIDPTKTIIEEFLDMIELSKAQKQYIVNEVILDTSLDDYVASFISLLEVIKEEPKDLTKKDIENIIECLTLIKKKIIIKK